MEALPFFLKSVSQRKVYETLETVKRGRTNATDARSGRPLRAMGRSISVSGTLEELTLMRLHLKRASDMLSTSQKYFILMEEAGNS
jgi:hypothetical protein